MLRRTVGVRCLAHLGNGREASRTDGRTIDEMGSMRELVLEALSAHHQRYKSMRTMGGVGFAVVAGLFGLVVGGMMTSRYSRPPLEIGLVFGLLPLCAAGVSVGMWISRARHKAAAQVPEQSPLWSLLTRRTQDVVQIIVQHVTVRAHGSAVSGHENVLIVTRDGKRHSFFAGQDAAKVADAVRALVATSPEPERACR